MWCMNNRSLTIRLDEELEQGLEAACAETGRSRGFGFVEMPNQSQGESAVKALDGSPISGRNLRVNEARPRTDRPQQRRQSY